MKLTLSQVESLANELIAFHTAAGDIPTGWTFKFNRQTSAVGLCVYRDRTIQVSKKWAEVLDEKIIKNTILHEIAHAITPGANHGPLWRQACVRIGARPETCTRVGDEAAKQVFDTYKYAIVLLDGGKLEVVGQRARIGRSLRTCQLTGRPETAGKVFYIHREHLAHPDAAQKVFYHKYR